MEEVKREAESLTRTQRNILDYFNTHDLKYVAEDAVFRHMHSGETYRGKAEIGAMLHFTYHVAFDAKAEVTNYVITEDKAVMECLFSGKHIGEFYGVPPSGKEVSVPMSVLYDLENGLIREARIYMATDVMRQQLSIAASGQQPRTAYITRDIFHLRFGHYREVKELLDEARKIGLLPPERFQRVLTDFTGDAYRLILEEGFDSLGEYERELTGELMQEEWQQWYKRFKEHVESGHREILKQVL